MFILPAYTQKPPRPRKEVIVWFKELNGTLRRCTGICKNPVCDAQSVMVVMLGLAATGFRTLSQIKGYRKWSANLPLGAM